LPDNIQVEDEVRRYQALFGGQAAAALQPSACDGARSDGAAGRVQALPHRRGTERHAGEHDDIHLQLFADSAKEVEIYLLNRNVDIDISETPHFKGGRHDPVETVSFLWHKRNRARRAV
jgi:hypothetical protein